MKSALVVETKYLLNNLMKAKIQKIKRWVKINKVNKLWLHMCSISERVSHAEKVNYANQMREVMLDSSDEQLDRTLEVLYRRIEEIELRRNPKKLPIKKEYSLL